MKKAIFQIFSILLLWMFSCTLFAQNQKVYIDSFTLDPLATAAKDYQKIDGNGNLYAIVKVRPSAKAFQITFGRMQSSIQGEHEDETWIYVQKDARYITIRREGFTPIREQDLGMTIEAGKTYILELSFVEPQIAVQKQWLKFSVSPSEANAIVKVKRDGASDYEIWGQTTDGTIARNLECGRYSYQILADNYDSSEGVVTLNKPNETFTEQVTLRPNFGFLQIDDAYGIAGAQIYVNNKLLGTIPYKSDTRWTSGEYNISITNGELYKTYNDKFVINKGETTVLKPRLESNAAETQLRVAADAEIYVDGRLVGTREWKGPLKAGRYEIECRQDKHYSSKKTITVIADEPQDVVLDAPAPITGTLNISSIPLDAEIRIDGQPVGVTPMTISNLLIGSHTVTLSRVNHQSEERTVTIEENKTANLEVKLSDMANMTIQSQPSDASLTINGVDKGHTPYSEILPSGDYDVKLTHAKYCDYAKRVHLDSSNPTLTIAMQPLYQLKSCFYLQPTFQAGALMGVGAAVGAYISNFNVEGDFLMGMGKESLYWNYFGSDNSKMPVEENFTASYFGARVGYGLTFGNRFRVTPQVGIGITSLFGDQDSKGNAMSLSLGSRLDYSITSFMGINLTPEYGLPMSQSEVFKTVSDVSSAVKGWGGSINIKVGIYFFF